MALHTPAHPMGTTHPHALRNALITVAAAAVIVALLVIADIVKVVEVGSPAAADHLMTPALIEFRAGERAAGYGAASISAGDGLMTPALIDFRAEERSIGYPSEYNGPH